MSDLDVQVRSMLAEAGIHGEGSDELVRLLSRLDATYVYGAVPEPGPELLALLGGGEAPTERPRRPRGRRAAATGLVALGVVVSTGWAAAANELPRPAQRWVADFSQRYLPFDLPYPRPLAPAGAPESTPERKDGSRWVEAPSSRLVGRKDTHGSSTRSGPLAYGEDSDVDERYVDEPEPDSEERSETGLREEREGATRRSAPEAEESEAETQAGTRQSAEDTDAEAVETSGDSESGDEYAGSAGEAGEESSDD